MGSRFTKTGLALACCLAVAAPAAAQSAADKETARSLMDQGNDLRDHGDLKGALARFEAANQIMHVPTTALEVARTRALLGLLVEARDTLAQIMSSVPTPREPAQFRQARAQAQTLDAELEARVPTVTVTVSGAAEGAAVNLSVDGVAVPSAVIGLPRRINPGHHVMIATTSTSEGRAEVDLKEGEKQDVSIVLAATAKPATTPTTTTEEEAPPPPAPEAHRSYALPIVLFSIGGAGLIAGGVTGALMLAKQSDLSTSCPNHVCPPSQYGQLDTANMLAMVSTVAFIAGGVGVAAGLVALLVGKPSAPAAPQAASIEPWLGFGSAGVRGTF